MTVAENVQMALISLQRPHARLVARRGRPLSRGGAGTCSSASGSAAEADRPCSELAYGDVKRVELAIALAGAPKLLLMDEPTAGMAPKERAQLMQLIAGIARERGIGVLFTEHDMDELEHLGLERTPRPASVQRPGLVEPLFQQNHLNDQWLDY